MNSISAFTAIGIAALNVGESIQREFRCNISGTRITKRAAAWIQSLLLNKVSIKAVQNITGIHWGTIRNIHIKLMESTLEERHQERKGNGYQGTESVPDFSCMICRHTVGISRSAIFADWMAAFDFKIGEIVIPDEGVVQSVFWLSWILEGIFMVFPHFLMVSVMKRCRNRLAVYSY